MTVNNDINDDSATKHGDSSSSRAPDGFGSGDKLICGRSASKPKEK